MASVKIILRARANKDGTHPLVLQIIKDRKKSIISLGYNIKQTDWDAEKQQVKRTYPNAVRMNNFLLKKRSDALGEVINVETSKQVVSAQSLKNALRPQKGATFASQANEYLESLKASGKYNQYTADKPRIGHFNEFLKSESVLFTDITPGLLERFKVFLKAYHIGKKNKKPMVERTIVNHLVVIRSVFAFARKNGVVKKEQTPFGGDDGIKIKFPDSKKVGISEKDVAKLEQVILENPKHDHARKIWLFSFYFAGMRISDVFRLRWSDFTNYRLHYSMGKNDKAGSLKIPDKAVEILKHYEGFKENRDDLVFPELKGVDLDNEFTTQRTIAFKTSALDKTLRSHVAPAAGIESKLTMHISRHTFGSLAGDTVPIQMLQKLYRHSHVSTTIGYQGNFINQEADNALDAVISKTNKEKSQPE